MYKIPPERNYTLLIVSLIGLFTGIFLWVQKPQEKDAQAVSRSEASGSEKLPQTEEEFEGDMVSHTVSEGDIPAEVFSEYGKLDANDVESLLAASRDTYDFTRLKIGRDLKFYFDKKEELKKIIYFPDTESQVIVEIKDGNFEAQKEDIPYRVSEETLYVKIDEFLYKDALDAGLTEASILGVADVFSFDIDFTTEIQEGDEVKVIYEKRTLDGKPAPDGRVIAAKFINVGQEYFAYYFESEDGGSHYDSEGHELMRQFLRAPLSYRRITSGYTGARFHPITKTVTAHYQIDYAAPVGTPVVATARGTVASAGWEGGWGNMVRLSHDNGYTTHYGHLSAYGKSVKSGASVSQGQVVGYVGSTGWSTGPHLDYGMKLNGSPVNPLSLKLPKGTPLEGGQMEKFQDTKRKYDELLK